MKPNLFIRTVAFVLIPCLIVDENHPERGTYLVEFTDDGQLSGVYGTRDYSDIQTGLGDDGFFRLTEEEDKPVSIKLGEETWRRMRSNDPASALHATHRCVNQLLDA